MKSKRTTSLRRLDLYLTVLESISKTHKLPKEPFIKKDDDRVILDSSRRQWYVNYLRENGYITKRGHATYDLTEAGKKFYKELQVKGQGVSEPIKLDLVLRVSFPIIKKLENPMPHDIDYKFKKHVRKYWWYSIPVYDINLTFQGPTTENNLIVYVHHMKIDSVDDVERIANIVKRWCRDYFSTQRILLLDELGTKVVHLKLGIHDPATEQAVKKIPKAIKEKIFLGRHRDKIFSKDTPSEASVWWDKTPDPYTVHTNDRTYMRRYLLMPENVQKLVILTEKQLELSQSSLLLQHESNANIRLDIKNRELHRSLLNDMKKTQVDISRGISDLVGTVKDDESLAKELYGVLGEIRRREEDYTGSIYGYATLLSHFLLFKARYKKEGTSHNG